MLDALGASADNESVKLTLHPLLLSAALLPLLTTGCDIRSTNPHQMTQLHEENMKLRTEIAQMENLIRMAGDDVPGLAERIAQREQELKGTEDELCSLIEQEADLKRRVLRLQRRLDTFQHTFNQMQNELGNANQANK